MSRAVENSAAISGIEKIIIIALGNRFRGDDGVGPVVADKLRSRLPGCAIVEGREDSMAIVNAWEDAELAVIIDAAFSSASPGSIHRLEVGDQPLSKDIARCSSHGLGLAEAVELGKVLKRLPARLVIYAAEASSFEVGTALSPQVSAAATQLALQVETEIVSFANAKLARDKKRVSDSIDLPQV